MYVFLLLVIFCTSSYAEDVSVASEAPTPLVPVLLNMSPEQRQQLETILLNTELTIAEMNTQVDEFFDGDDINPSLKSQYLAMKQAFSESLKILNQEHSEAIKNASPECQKADVEIRAIADDENLTMIEQNRKILQIYKAQSPKIQKELNKYAIYKRTEQSSSSSGF